MTTSPPEISDQQSTINNLFRTALTKSLRPIVPVYKSSNGDYYLPKWRSEVPESVLYPKDFGNQDAVDKVFKYWARSNIIGYAELFSHEFGPYICLDVDVRRDKDGRVTKDGRLTLNEYEPFETLSKPSASKDSTHYVFKLTELQHQTFLNMSVDMNALGDNVDIVWTQPQWVMGAGCVRTKYGEKQTYGDWGSDPITNLPTDMFRKIVDFKKKTGPAEEIELPLKLGTRDKSLISIIYNGLNSGTDVHNVEASVRDAYKYMEKDGEEYPLSKYLDKIKHAVVNDTNQYIAKRINGRHKLGSAIDVGDQDKIDDIVRSSKLVVKATERFVYNLATEKYIDILNPNTELNTLNAIYPGKRYPDIYGPYIDKDGSIKPMLVTMNEAFHSHPSRRVVDSTRYHPRKSLFFSETLETKAPDGPVIKVIRNFFNIYRHPYLEMIKPTCDRDWDIINTFSAVVGRAAGVCPEDGLFQDLKMRVRWMTDSETVGFKSRYCTLLSGASGCGKGVAVVFFMEVAGPGNTVIIPKAHLNQTSTETSKLDKCTLAVCQEVEITEKNFEYVKTIVGDQKQFIRNLYGRGSDGVQETFFWLFGTTNDIGKIYMLETDRKFQVYDDSTEVTKEQEANGIRLGKILEHTDADIRKHAMGLIIWSIYQEFPTLESIKEFNPFGRPKSNATSRALCLKTTVGDDISPIKTLQVEILAGAEGMFVGDFASEFDVEYLLRSNNVPFRGSAKAFVSSVSSSVMDKRGSMLRAIRIPKLSDSIHGKLWPDTKSVGHYDIETYKNHKISTFTIYSKKVPWYIVRNYKFWRALIRMEHASGSYELFHRAKASHIYRNHPYQIDDQGRPRVGHTSLDLHGYPCIYSNVSSPTLVLEADPKRPGKFLKPTRHEKYLELTDTSVFDEIKEKYGLVRETILQTS